MTRTAMALLLLLAASANAQDGVSVFHDAAGRVTGKATTRNGATAFTIPPVASPARRAPTRKARPRSTMPPGASPAKRDENTCPHSGLSAMRAN